VVAVVAVGTTVGVVRLVNGSTPPPPTPTRSESVTEAPATAEPAPVITGVAPFGVYAPLGGHGDWVDQEYGVPYTPGMGPYELPNVYAGLENNGVSIDPGQCELYVDDERVSDAEVVLETSGAGWPVVHFRLARPIDEFFHILRVTIVSTDGQRDTCEWDLGPGEN